MLASWAMNHMIHAFEAPLLGFPVPGVIQKSMHHTVKTDQARLRVYLLKQATFLTHLKHTHTNDHPVVDLAP